MKKIIGLCICLFALASFAAASTITFSSVTPGGATTGSAPYDLTSTNTTYSLLAFDPIQTFTFGSITDIDLNYNAVKGGIGGGAPRIEVDFTDSTSLLVLLGPAGTFVNPTLGIANSGNLVAMDDVGRYDLSQGGLGGSGYTNYDAAVAAAGTKTIADLQVIIDSFGGNDKEFKIGADSLHVSANVTAPEPATFGLMGFALVGIGLLRKRKMVKM